MLDRLLESVRRGAPMLDRLGALPEPQQHALRIAFGLSSGDAPDRFLVAWAFLQTAQDRMRCGGVSYGEGVGRLVGSVVSVGYVSAPVASTSTAWCSTTSSSLMWTRR